MSCQTHVPNVNTVLEIGGGYGAPARLWLRSPVRPAQCFIILDIAESLFFADVFLRREFGEASVHYVETASPVDPEIVAKHKVILCPLPRHEALRDLPVDLVVNTGSMQEMSEDWVSFYSSYLDRLSCRRFYSLNYFAQPISYLAESVNLWSPRVSSRWVARLLRWNPAFVRMQADRNYLEALYERSDEPAPGRHEALATLQLLAPRAMTGEIFAECMDVVRRVPEPEIMLKVVRRTLQALPFVPKELAYLVEALLKSRTGNLDASTVEELKGYQDRLGQQRRAGKEALY